MIRSWEDMTQEAGLMLAKKNVDLIVENKTLKEKLGIAMEALGNLAVHSFKCATVEAGVRHGCTCEAWKAEEALTKIGDS